MIRESGASGSGDPAQSGAGRSPQRAFLGLGGNVGDVAARFDDAIRMLDAAAGLVVVGRSSLWRTPPWGDENQPPFLNACLEVATSLEPLALLELCLEVERRLGRDRHAPEARRWGPRPIDIDVLDLAGAAMDTPRLTLPHPRLGERAFALAPLVELAPELLVQVHLEGGRPVRIPALQALALLPVEGLERLN